MDISVVITLHISAADSGTENRAAAQNLSEAGDGS